MSPSEPTPKPTQPRHPNGWMPGRYGCSGLGPRYTSHARSAGTGAGTVAGTPCGHQPLGRLVHDWTARMGPSTPARTTSTTRRPSSPEWPWLPICVTAPVWVAFAARRRLSSTVNVSGFWQ